MSIAGLRKKRDRLWQRQEQEALAPRMAIIDSLPTPAIFEAMDKKLTHDARLLKLSIGVGLLGVAMGRPWIDQAFGTVGRLRQVAGYCAGWLVRLGVKEPPQALSKERDRQIRLRRRHPDRYLVDVAHPTPDEARKYRVLVEELGEVAKAIDKWEMSPTPEALRELRAEITQVGAVALAWLESKEVRS